MTVAYSGENEQLFRKIDKNVHHETGVGVHDEPVSLFMMSRKMQLSTKPSKSG